MRRNKSASGKFLNDMAAPARRALEAKGIISVKQLSACREADLLELHGLGLATLPKLRKALKDAGLTFKK